MELHIEGQHIEVSDDLRTMITDRLEKLNVHHGTSYMPVFPW